MCISQETTWYQYTPLNYVALNSLLESNATKEMRIGELPDTLLRDVCEYLTTGRDVMEEFVEAFGFPRDILKDFYLHKIYLNPRKHPRDILFGILKKHSVTPVQLLRNVCATLCDDDAVVELLHDALRSYKSAPPLHLVRPLEEIRDIHKERIQRKPITYVQRGAILIMDFRHRLSVGGELESFFMDLDPTSKVTRVNTHRGSIAIIETLRSWRQNQGQ